MTDMLVEMAQRQRLSEVAAYCPRSQSGSHHWQQVRILDLDWLRRQVGTHLFKRTVQDLPENVTFPWQYCLACDKLEYRPEPQA